mmetsp:Transcript_34485/g.80090  ORF Transcript_34485/g.80090 Transcript_34485/m.80090 type:complete len:263 (-) Transcript_34485:1040-1828(-)
MVWTKRCKCCTTRGQSSEILPRGLCSSELCKLSRKLCSLGVPAKAVQNAATQTSRNVPLRAKRVASVASLWLKRACLTLFLIRHLLARSTWAPWPKRQASTRPPCVLLLLRLQGHAGLVNVLQELIPDAEKLLTSLLGGAVLHVEVLAQLPVHLDQALVTHMQLLQLSYAHGQHFSMLHEDVFLCALECGAHHLQQAVALGSESAQLLCDLFKLWAGSPTDLLNILPRGEHLLNLTGVLHLHLLDKVINQCARLVTLAGLAL